MPFTVTMPKLSPTMEEGSIAKWHKQEGDRVSAGDLLAEIATDKATVEFNALDEGYLRKILVTEGQMAQLGQPIAIFTVTADEAIDSYKPEAITSNEPKQEEAPKTETETAAPTSEVKVAPKSAMQMPSFTPEPPLENYRFPFATSQKQIKATPLAKKLAKEKGLDISSVKGSGPKGRVSSRDLNLALPSAPVSFSKGQTPQEAPGSYEEVPLTPMRKSIAQRLQQSKMSVPHIYVRQEIDAAPLVTLRDQLKESGLKLTYNDLVIRACALALREHPEVNSGFDSANQTIIRFKTIDISVAVTVENGLITPIIRHADYKNVGEISAEVKELAARAKAGKLSPEEYRGGSFTISNMGMFGVTDFCAIINPPQAAILAIGGIDECAVVKNGAIVLGKRMNLVLSADHRVLDGTVAARFIKTVQKYLENPAILLIGP